MLIAARGGRGFILGKEVELLVLDVTPPEMLTLALVHLAHEINSSNPVIVPSSFFVVSFDLSAGVIPKREKI
jgi:hypothetical protein